jgi:hypothetical protein
MPFPTIPKASLQQQEPKAIDTIPVRKSNMLPPTLPRRPPKEQGLSTSIRSKNAVLKVHKDLQTQNANFYRALGSGRRVPLGVSPFSYLISDANAEPRLLPRIPVPPSKPSFARSGQNRPAFGTGTWWSRE